jgi:hypothetical protein
MCDFEVLKIFRQLIQRTGLPQLILLFCWRCCVVETVSSPSRKQTSASLTPPAISRDTYPCTPIRHAIC